jgi:putative PIN family toxin of toxin-antitoxin system
VDVVLDTNVIISAVISHLGPPAQIHAAWQDGQFVYVTSPVLVEEIARALTYPRVTRRRAWTETERSAYLETLRANVRLVLPTVRIDAMLDDPDDNRVLEAAVAGGAQYIVTGDRDLLELASYESIEIVTPARFLAVLATSGG